MSKAKRAAYAAAVGQVVARFDGQTTCLARIIDGCEPHVAAACRDANEAHSYYPQPKRVRQVPLQLEAARRKVAALEAEARRLGMHDLLERAA